MLVAGKLGKLDPQRPDGLADLTAYTDKILPTGPAQVDNTTGIAGWEMALNDTYGDCLGPDTKVLTADLRWISVQDIKEGDLLIGFDENPTSKTFRQYRTSIVERSELIVKPCYDLTLSDGTVIRASYDHQWLRKSRGAGHMSWLKTDQIKVGQGKSSNLMRCLSPWEFKDDYNSGYLAGALDGEGCLAFSSDLGTIKALQFAQRDNIMLDTTKSILDDYGIKYTQVNIGSSSLSTRGYSYLRISDRQQVLKVLGLTQPPRLMSMFSPDKLGSLYTQSVSVIDKKFVGDQWVVALQTSTRTFIAEGFASHNCTIAAVTHMDKAWCHQTNETYTYPGDPAISSTYFDLSGGQDSGLVEADVLSAWHNTGLFNKKIIGYAPVNIRDLRTIKAAIHLFGGIYTGVQIPGVAQQQFENNQEWNPTGNHLEDNNIVGGHAIPLLGYSLIHNQLHFKCITWGAVQVLTASWWKMYADEAWAIIPEEYQDAAASFGLDIQMLENDLPLVAH